MKAEKWDVKCVGDSNFFRLSLRPNLAMRNREEVVLGREIERNNDQPELFVGQVPDYPYAY